MRSLLAAILFVLVAAVRSGAEVPWAVYYADGAAPQEYRAFSLLVLDSEHHPPLAPLAKDGKILLGYISLGEVESHRPYFTAVQREGILLQENANWKGSFFVDVRDRRWSARVLDQLVPQILSAGFAGVFLDTLDNPGHLERTDAKKYAGMTAAAAALVRAIRQRYPTIKIMMNRGYDLLPQVEAGLDYELGESVFADYDFKTKQYAFVPRAQYETQMQLLKAAARRQKHLQIFTLDYWIDDAAWVEPIWDEVMRSLQIGVKIKDPTNRRLN